MFSKLLATNRPIMYTLENKSKFLTLCYYIKYFFRPSSFYTPKPGLSQHQNIWAFCASTFILTSYVVPYLYHFLQ